MKKGIDISYHQGEIDFNRVKKSGVEFVIIREGYSQTTDRKFFEYVEKAKAAGIDIFGIYHFSYALTPEGAEKEAIYAINNAEKAKLNPRRTFIFFDFEYDTVEKALRNHGTVLCKEDCNYHTQAFCNKVLETSDYQTGIYTNLDYYKNWYEKETLSRYPIWLADYSGGPDFDCIVQQYSSKGSIEGINGSVDLNYLYDEKIDIEKSDCTEEDRLMDVAIEVKNGVWGNGLDRKIALTNAGYVYEDVQKIVNKMLNGAADRPTEKEQNEIQEIRKARTSIEAAKKFDSKLSGTYITTDNLYMRNGAGKDKTAMVIIPKGYKVRNYGYYSMSNGVKWLYIQVTIDGIQYTGFSSSRCLERK